MAGLIAQQPNGLYCRFSTVIDDVTNVNMTREEYVNICMERAKAEAEEILSSKLVPFDYFVQLVKESNINSNEFLRFLDQTHDPVDNNKSEVK